MDYIDFVCDGPPGPEAGRFVEVEDTSGHSINAGEWVHRDDGFWALRVPSDASLRAEVARLRAALLRYGHHDDGCASWEDGPKFCTCGFGAAVGKE